MRTALSSVYWQPPAMFLLIRLMAMLTLSLEGLYGFGDVDYYYRLANLGRPYLDMWVEYPPAFPWISRGIFLLAEGREHIYLYLCVMLFSLFQAGNIYLFAKLDVNSNPSEAGRQRPWLYMILLAGLPYGAWYFEPLAVFFMLLGVYWLMQDKAWRAGIALAAGVLVKLFPILGLALVWKKSPLRRAVLVTMIVVGLTVSGYGVFSIFAPEYTFASLKSQFSKEPWETIYALLQGNYQTGNLGPLVERLNPDSILSAGAADFSLWSWLMLALFLLLGLWLYRKSEIPDTRRALSFLGLTWSVFLLWSPGWSPQWILFLLPFVICCLPMPRGAVFAIVLILVNLLEWPVLLTRGYTWGLWLTVPLRTALFALLGFEFWRVIRERERIGTRSELDWKTGARPLR